MNELNLTPEKMARRLKFLADTEMEYPSVKDFVITNSGVVEPLPQTKEEWDDFNENLRLVDGIDRVHARG